MKSIPLMVGALCMLTVSVMAQSLGEVAKKAEVERQVQKAASKVYTDTDLKDLSRPAAAPAAPTATREQSEGDRPDEYRKIARKDEASWKERMRHAQAALDADRVFLAAATARERELDKRLRRGENDVLYIRGDRLRAEVDGQWQAAVAEVSRLTAAVEVDRQAIVAPQEEARRANVPPGWLRP
jgi:hypothetical protein